jgi:iron complex outermembrane receptor protein
LDYKASGCYPPTDPANLHFDPSIPPFVTCQDALGHTVAGDPFRYFPVGWNTQNFYEFTPTLGAQYHVNDDLMFYVSWSKGFKSGGWTTRLSAPIADASLAEFGPEKAQTYEVGMKSEWFDHHLVLNLAGFYTKYDDIQLNEQQGASPVLSNLGSADIYGAEVEVQADVGNGFFVRGNLGYLDAYYTFVDPKVAQITPGAPSITLDSKLPKTPKWHISIGPQYVYNFQNGTSLQLLVQYTYTSEMFNDAENTPLLRHKPASVVDATAHYLFGNGKYDLAVGGTNIFDERYIIIGSHNYAAGFVDATYNPPGQWYATITAKF